MRRQAGQPVRGCDHVPAGADCAEDRMRRVLQPGRGTDCCGDLYGKTAVRKVVIDKKNWFKKKYNLTTNFKKQYTDLEYIPYENLSKINIQEPLIVLFIHDGNGFYNRIGTDLAVVHIGFLLPNNILRHASKQYGRVLDVNFEQYVANRKKNEHNLGIALVKIK